MGGPMQPQGHLQVVSNLVDYHLNPQAAIDAPRWHFVRGNLLLLEPSVPDSVVEDLRDRAHEVRVSNREHLFGRGQIILKENGVFFAGSEPRTDGMAIAF